MTLKLVDYFHVQADNPWYNYYLFDFSSCSLLTVSCLWSVNKAFPWSCSIVFLFFSDIILCSNRFSMVTWWQLKLSLSDRVILSLLVAIIQILPNFPSLNFLKPTLCKGTIIIYQLGGGGGVDFFVCVRGEEVMSWNLTLLGEGVKIYCLWPCSLAVPVLAGWV